MWKQAYEKGPTSCVIRETKIKTTARYAYTPISVARIQNAGEDVSPQARALSLPLLLSLFW